MSGNKEQFLRDCLIELDRVELKRDDIRFSMLQNVEFSDNELEKEFRSYVKKHKPLNRFTATKARRVATIVTALFIVSTATLLTFKGEAIIKAVAEFFGIEVHDTYTKNDAVFPPGTQRETIEDKYKIADLPEGYEQAEENELVNPLGNMTRYAIMYLNGTGYDNYIDFSQSTNPDGALEDTEREDGSTVEMESVQVGASAGTYYANKGVHTLTWGYDGYQFRISSPETSADKDALIKMANSIERQ